MRLRWYVIFFFAKIHRGPLNVDINLAYGRPFQNILIAFSSPLPHKRMRSSHLSIDHGKLIWNEEITNFKGGNLANLYLMQNDYVLIKGGVLQPTTPNEGCSSSGAPDLPLTQPELLHGTGALLISDCHHTTDSKSTPPRKAVPDSLTCKEL